MFDRAGTAGRVLIEAFMYRAHPQTKLLHEIIADGAIGEIRLIRTNFTFIAKRHGTTLVFKPAPEAARSWTSAVTVSISPELSLLGVRNLTGFNVSLHRHEFGVDDYAAGSPGFSEWRSRYLHLRHDGGLRSDCPHRGNRRPY